MAAQKHLTIVLWPRQRNKMLQNKTLPAMFSWTSVRSPKKNFLLYGKVITSNVLLVVMTLTLTQVFVQRYCPRRSRSPENTIWRSQRLAM